MELRDKNGLTEKEFLDQYDSSMWPHPSVTADIAVVAHDGEKCELLLIKRGGHPFLGRWALPGGFAEENEPLYGTAARELREETGITGVSLVPVGVFSEPGRDPRGWLITEAFRADIEKNEAAAEAGDDAADARWFEVIRDSSGGISLRSGSIEISVVPDSGLLAADHAQIIRAALR